MDLGGCCGGVHAACMVFMRAGRGSLPPPPWEEQHEVLPREEKRPWHGGSSSARGVASRRREKSEVRGCRLHRTIRCFSCRRPRKLLLCRRYRHILGCNSWPSFAPVGDAASLSQIPPAKACCHLSIHNKPAMIWGKGDYQIDYVPAPRITEADNENDRNAPQDMACGCQMTEETSQDYATSESYADFFEKPSTIQQRGIVLFCSRLDVIQQAQSGAGKTATLCSVFLQ